MVILTIAACLVGGARSDTHTSHHPHLFVHSLLAQQSHYRFQENPPDISYCQRQWRNSVDFIGGGGGGVGGVAKVSCIRMRRILCKTREVSNNMRPLLHYKCLNFELLLIIGKYGSEHFPGRILALYVEYFLYLMYFKDSRAFHFFYKVFHHFACVVKINREILLHSAMDSTLFTHRIKLLLVFFLLFKIHAHVVEL